MDITKYHTVSDFYLDAQAHGIRVPTPLCLGLTQLMKAKNLSFQEAYNFLLERQMIIEAGRFLIYNMSACKLWT